jgi:hypothetical protein
MWRLYVIGAGCLLLLSIFVYYWWDERVKDKERKRLREHGSLVPNPTPNDEFAGTGVLSSVLPQGFCGVVRPGEWQCNCADQSSPCATLLSLKSKLERAEDKNMTDRRGAIAAQKARKANGN